MPSEKKSADGNAARARRAPKKATARARKDDARDAAKAPMTDTAKALLGMAGGIALACAVFFGFSLASRLLPEPVKIVQHQPVPTQPEPVEQIPPPLEEALTGEKLTAARLKEARERFAEFTLRTSEWPSKLVAWQSPEPTTDFGFATTSEDGCTVVPGVQMKLGSFIGGALKGKDLYMFNVETCGMGISFSPVYAVLDPDARIAYVLTRYSYDENIEFPGGVAPEGETGIVTEALAAGGYAIDFDDMRIPELEFPDEIILKSPAVTLRKAFLPFSAGGQEWLSFSADEEPAFVHPALGPAFEEPKTGGFVFQGPEGLLHRYALNIPFKKLVDGWVKFDITLNDGTPLAGDYSEASLGGCGASNFLHLNDVPMERLRVAGATSTGDDIYELVATDDPLLVDAYGKAFVPPGQAKQSYEEFVASLPMFFWVDPFGRMVEFDDATRNRYVECGKPVIYLYPEVTTDVSVRVAPTGGFTYTDPDYGGGWEVTAEPSGRLTERATGRTYPYLFWEGRSNDLWPDVTSGFVVAHAEVPAFLDRALAAQGLNAQEIADFKGYWVPRFVGSPYYMVTFGGNKLMDRIAPLTIEPKPDTVIRVLMDFVGLEAPVRSVEPRLSAPKRRGFTVVEWGGVKR